MSDPVTNVEIEDVLSSIRRLVSQDGGARPAVLSNPEPEAVAEDAPVEAPEEDGADALVLTQDHRIDDVNNAAEAAGLRVEDARREAATAVRSELERAIEELEAAMGIAEREAPATAEAAPMPEAAEPAAVEVVDEAPTDLAEEEIDWEAPVGRAMEGTPPSFDERAEEFDPDQVQEEASFAEPSEDAPAPEDFAEDRAEGWPEDESEEAAQVWEAEASEEATSEAASDGGAEEDTAEAPEFFEYAPAVDEAAEEDAAEDVAEAAEADPIEADTEGSFEEEVFAEIEGSEDDLAASEEPVADEEAVEVEDIATAEANDDVEAEAQDETEMEAEAEPDVEDAAPFFQHSAVERLHLVSDAGDSADVAYSGQYEETYDDGLSEDPIPAQVEATLEDQGDYFEAPEGPFDSAKDDPFPGTDVEGADDQVVALDEEQLRDMVAEIVREELQGELGERITRNVRKLVRREINRALAGQDLI